MITHLLQSERLARVVNYLIFGTWPAKPQPRPVLVTRPPYGPGDPRYHVGFAVEDLGMDRLRREILTDSVTT